MIGLIKGTARQLKTVSGLPLPIASYKSNSKLPIKAIGLPFSCTQSGSGDPAPDNIRPITGVSSVDVCNTPMPVAPLWSIDSSFNGVVNFNQFVRYLSASTGIGYWSKSYSISTISVNAETNSVNYDNNSASGGRLRYGCEQINNHKYLLCGYVTSNVSGNLRIEMSRGWGGVFKSITQNVKSFVSTIINTYSAGEDNNKVAQWYIANETDYSLTLDNWVIIDLTQMFRSTIADYIYSLEQGEEGAGVAFFRSIYPNDYYAYDTGTDEMVGSREGNTYTIDLDGTRYGGRIDIVDGEAVMTVTWAKYTIDSNTILGAYTTSAQYGSWARVYSIGVQKISTDKVCAISNYATGVSYENRVTNPNTQRVYIDEQGYVVIRASVSDNVTTENDLKNLFLGADIIYKLATPITVNLGSLSVPSLLGQNNLWHDGNGDVDELVYVNRQLYYGR